MKNTTLCYIENPAGEYLMLHRVKKENDCNHDKWIGVGGKFEDGESPEECVLRETLEEKQIPMAAAEVTMIPQSYVELTDEQDLYHINKLLSLLEEDDDVQEVYHNWDE